MSKLVVCNLMSLDGYIAGPGGDVMVLPLDESFSAYNIERLRAADTMLVGRTTYTGFLSYWPAIADDQNQPAVEREISSINNRIDKVVVSDTLSPDDTGVWRETTRILRRAEAHEQIAELKRHGEGDILTFGSTTLWNDLLAAGLVDELHLMVGNAALGAGDPAFMAASPAALTLAEVRQLEGSDNVLLKYVVG
ncbi:MAG: deaminase [Propionibacteriales bacterium]|nr:deaminase [Propionibacteriales bacterium]